MAIISLLKTNPLICKQSFPIRSPSPCLLPNNTITTFTPKTVKYNMSGRNLIKANSFFATKSCGTNFKGTSSSTYLLDVHETSNCVRTSNEVKSSNPFEGIASIVLQALEGLKKPAVMAIWIALLLMHDPHFALAASGGRMGGSSFSSRSSSSSSSRSSSSSSSYSSSSSSRSSSSPSSSSHSFSSSSQSSPSSSSVSSELDYKFWIIWLAVWLVVIVLFGYADLAMEGSTTEPISILKLQVTCSTPFYIVSLAVLTPLVVGLLGSARSLQTDLNRICQTANTSSVQGFSYILTETTVSLLRHPNYWISGHSSVSVMYSVQGAEQEFNKLSIGERQKLDDETLVNIASNIRSKRRMSNKIEYLYNECIVVTILVAADQKRSLPLINANGDLAKALQSLGSIPSSQLVAVEVLWTPQEENDALSGKELHEKYPHLRTI